MLVFNMLFLFWKPPIQAQKVTLNRSHALSTPSAANLTAVDATGTLNVVAIMVEYQPDDNRLTTGTGLFGQNGMDGLPFLQRAEDVRIEPLPHDRSYFEAHLEYAKNYFEKSSDGQLTINYQVLPDIYRLPLKMESYSPIGETFTNEKIAQLAQDAWQEVENGSSFDASGLDPENTAFVIFHAGVGRDIELTGTNLNITPFDIPSLYLGKEQLRSLLGEPPSFTGFSVNDGSFQVTNSLIIPRTESRPGLDIQENEFVFPLSINGLLIASLASHLGLPDLFDTNTGAPAIGRFGLMDGASFFAYNGLLPPEPSAWEKIYLGWETSTTINPSNPNLINLSASSLAQPANIARVDLSESEYFLIENRHRDPNNTGITLTIRTPSGTEVQQTFTNEDEDFVFQLAGFDTLLEAGTLLNASNFDFSLPGGLDIGLLENDPSDDRDLDGGILIWHIDEAMIESRLVNGGINADPTRRGVDLEEADGAQDIGPGVPGALDNSASFGTPFDFWWSGNDYRVILQSGQERSFYENRFGTDTRPSNSSNSGAPSFFELYDFSDNQPNASFKIRPVEPFSEIYTRSFSVQLDPSLNYYTNDDPYYNYYPLSLSIYETPADTFLIIPSNEGVTAVSLASPENSETRISESAVQLPFIGDELILAEKPTNTNANINVASISWDPNTSQFDTTWTSTLSANKGFLSSQNGEIIHADLTSTALSAIGGNPINLNGSPFQRSEIISGDYSEVTDISGNTQVTISSDSDYLFLPEASFGRAYTGNIYLENRSVFYMFEDNRFVLIDPAASVKESVIFEDEQAEWPAILDDASVLHINRSKNQLIGYNSVGAVSANTPIQAPEGVKFIGTPLYTDLLSSGSNYAAIVVGQDSLSINLYAYSGDGNLVEGFPLYVGNAVADNIQPIHPMIYEGVLYALSHKGTLKAWKLTQVTDTRWGSRYGNTPFNKVSGRVADTQSGQGSAFGVLNEDETYNWPNPAGDQTNIRFELAAPGGTVEVTIITMSGLIIYEETLNSSGGHPQEINVDTSQWGSGGYVARVKATVEGKSETELIKIAVVQ